MSILARLSDALPWPRRHRASGALAVRRFDAAAGGRRATGFGFFGRTQPEVSAAATLVRSRARHAAANHPFISNAVGNWVGALVGTGIVPTGDAEAVSRFNTWADIADADGRTDFWGLQTDIARALVIDGEAFIQLMDSDEGPRVRLVPAELVDESRTLNLGDGGFCVSGVEFNAQGEREAYWVLPSLPSDIFETARPAVRIPAADMLHVMKPIGVGQVRGISWLAPIIVPATELDAIVDALAVGVKIAALHAGFLVDQNNVAGAPFAEGDLDDLSLEPGTLRRLPGGFDIKFSSPQQAAEIGSFLSFNLRMLAAGLGLPEHLVSGDLTGANYSSLRAGLLPFRQRVEQAQYGVLAPQLLRPIWRRVHSGALLLGEIEALPVADWLPPAWMQVDPAKQAEADAAELAAGLTSRRKLVAARGWSIAELDTEIAADRQREATLGLSFGQSKEGKSDA